MRKLIFFLVVIACVCAAFPEINRRNNATLTINTSDPIQRSILTEMVDSVTFSNIGLDGTLHDSAVVQKIHIGDSTYYYVLDSITSVNITRHEADLEVWENFSSLSKYLDETKSLHVDSATVVSRIMVWLNEQPEIISAELMDYGIEVKYALGKTGYVIFDYIDDMDVDDVYDNQQKNKMNVIPSESKVYGLSDSHIAYHCIGTDYTEETLYNTEILVFKAVDDIIMSWISLTYDEDEYYKEYLNRTPINASIRYNKRYGDLNELVLGLNNSDVTIITHTHGCEDGGFMITDNAYFDVSDDLVSPIFNAAFKDGVLEKWNRVELWDRNVYLVHPHFFKRYPTGKGVGVLNYCWSEGLRKTIENHYENAPHKNFASYAEKTYFKENTLRVSYYLYLLMSGYTHDEAVKNTNTIDYNDGQKFVTTQEESTPKKRFLGIEELEKSIVYNKTLFPEKDCAWVEFIIHGWKNLKKDVKKLKIWCKGEPFSCPDETCMSYEYDFSTFSWMGYDRLFIPCSEYDPDGIKPYRINYEGPAFYAGLYVYGIEADTLYYTLGFEYNDGERNNIYYGNVGSITGIRSGVTPGQCIDMGLPSGTKWAAWNIGASAPEEKGETYGWGEPTGSYREQPEVYFVFDKIVDTYPEVVPHYGGENPLPNISGSQWDIAWSKWGNGWKLPTTEQWNELFDENNTIIHTYNLHGIYGIRIISKINGNKIFFPLQMNNLGNVCDCSFWSGDLDVSSENQYNAFYALISDVEYSASGQITKGVYSDRRWHMKYVRAVKE